MIKTFISSGIAALIMFLVLYETNHLLAQYLSASFSISAVLNIIALCALGASIYLLLMATIFRIETKNFFKECMDLAPETLKPIIQKIQCLIKLT